MIDWRNGHTITQNNSTRTLSHASSHASKSKGISRFFGKFKKSKSVENLYSNTSALSLPVSTASTMEYDRAVLDAKEAEIARMRRLHLQQATQRMRPMSSSGEVTPFSP